MVAAIAVCIVWHYEYLSLVGREEIFGGGNEKLLGDGVYLGWIFSDGGWADFLLLGVSLSIFPVRNQWRFTSFLYQRLNYGDEY